MNRYRRPLLVLGLTLLLLWLAPWQPSETSRSSPAPVPAGNGADPQAAAEPGQDIPSAPGPRLNQSVAETSAIDALLTSSKVLDERNSPDATRPSARRKTQLVESSFKYPLLQIDETWQRNATTGKEQRISRTVQVADHAMMRFPAGFDRQQIAAWCAGHGLAIRHKLKTDDVFLIQIPNAAIDAVASLVREFQVTFGTDQTLALAEPDFLVFADATPSDPSFGQLWGLHNTGQSSGVADADIDAPEAWSLSTGSRDVIVGIIDTGIDGSHPDLAANMYTNPHEIPANGIDDDANGFVDDVHGWDFYADDSDPIDTNGHGTHCAGTIGGVGDNLIGVAGVNWEVSLVALQFLGPGGSGSTSDAVDAVNYGRKLGLTLTSNSWGGGGYSSTLEQAIRDAGTVGQLFIAAAGNDASDNDIIPHYPSTYNLDNVIAVASTTRTDALSSFSCFGKTTVDLAAPGSDIYSTTPGNTYGSKSGTSMATPHVSGAAALLYAISPDRSHIDIKDVLLQTADPLPALNGICVSGGRLNLHRAAEYVAGPRVIPSVIAQAELVGNGDGIASPGETITLDVTFKNVGSEPAASSIATLGLDVPMSGVSVVGGPFPLGYLDPGQLTGIHRFTITLAASFPTPAKLPLKFTVAPTVGESWTTLRPLDVHSFHRVSGQVLRKDGLGPIGGATLTYSGPVSGTITANASGHFDFQVWEGSYQIRASAAGYMEGAPVSVTLPPDAQGLQFHLGNAQLSVAPESIAVSLPAGDSTTRTVQITNNGNVPLQWQSRVTLMPPDQGTSLPAHVAGIEEDPDHAGAVRVRETLPRVEDTGADLNGVAIGMITGSYPDFAAEMTSRGATVSALSLPLGPTSLNAISIVVIDDTAASLTTADIALLREWTLTGGALFLEGDESVSMGNINALSNGSGIQGVVYNTFNSDTLTDIASHEITRDVTSIGATSYGAHCAVSGSAQALVHTPSGDVFAAASWLGLGRVFMVGNEVHYASDWSTGQTRLFINQAVDWLASRGRWLQVADPGSGTLAPGVSTTVTLLFNASYVEAGIYQGTLVLTSDSATARKREIPVHLTVSDAPAVAFDPAELLFPDSPVNGTVIRDIAIDNPGTQPLSISAIATNHPAFSVVSPAPLTLAPQQHLVLPVTFRPGSIGLQQGTLTISSNDPTHPQLSAQLRGTGYTGALLNHNPQSFSVSVPQGTTRTEQLLISNPGDMPLEWSASMIDTSLESANDTDALADLLGDLDRDYQKITSLIPGRFDFTDGVTGTNISDGGSDMYDGGNYLATNLATTSLAYSDGKITTSPTSLGPGGRYFTRKYPGLFVLSAEMEGVESFQITGNTGADGSGTVNGSELAMSFHGKSYRGFLKRTYGTSSPSINQLVIVEDTPGLGHSFPADTNEDDHTVSGLVGTQRIHYLLYASSGGSALGVEEVARPIMAAFLAMIDPGLSWAYVEPFSGTVPPGGSAVVQMRFDASNAAAGSHKGILSLQHNQAGRPPAAIPLAMLVTAAPLLQVSAESLQYQPTSLGNSRSQSLKITTAGSATLSVQAALAGSSSFSLPVSASLQLAAGETRSLAIHFTPLVLGEASGNLVLTTNVAGLPSRQIGLHGSGIAAGGLSISPKALNLSVASGSSLTQNLSIANSSASGVSWNVTALPVGDGSLTKQLQGLKALVISSSSSYYDDLVARLRAEGADATYANYYNVVAGDLTGKHLLFIDGNLDYLPTAVFPLLRPWIMDGGTLVLANPSGSYSYSNSVLADSGIIFSYWGYSSPAVTFLPHPATTGITSLPSAVYYGQFTLAGPAVPIAKMGTTTVGAVSFLGRGRVACFGDDVFIDRSGVSHLDLAVRVSAWGSRRTIDWLDLSPMIGGNNANSTSPLQVTANGNGLAAGEYFAEIHVNTYNTAENLTVPVRLTVTGTPDLEITPGSITLPTTYPGSFVEQDLTLENRGTAASLISGIDSSTPELQVVGIDFPLNIPAFGKTVVRVRYQPTTASGPLSASLTIHSNEVAQPALQVPVTGSAILPPVAVLQTPLPLQLTLAAGTTATGTFTLGNQGSSALNWSVPSITVPAATDLGTALSKLDANQGVVTGAIPYREQFDEGITGNQIIDGGANLYDGGNRLSTDLSDIDILYANGVVTPAAGSLGTGGQYFTRKYPGLFVFAADLNNVKEFRIRGNLGANGTGIAAGSSVLLQRGQTTYRGFTKRVQGPGLRPLHHLVIVEDKPGLAHTFAGDTNDDAHTISGLAANTRIYHLAYVGTTGSVSNDAQVQGIMSIFLDAIQGTPAFRTANPTSGTITAGSSTDITVTANANGLIAGVYRSSMELTTNDPARPVVLVPVELTVIGTPAITVSRTSATFASVFAGANATTITANVTNSGTEVLAISSITIDAPFTVTPTESSFTLVPGASRTLTLGFKSTQVGTFQGTLTITSNAANKPVSEIALNGTATPPPVFSTTATPYTVNLQGGLTTATRSFDIGNPGGAALQWNASVDYALYTAPNGKDLQGVKIGIISAYSSFLDYLEASLVARGATITYLGAGASPDPSPYNVILLDQTVDSLSTAYITTLRTWIENGGCMLVGTVNPSFTKINSLMTGSGIVGAQNTGSSSSILQIVPHPITSGISSVYDFSYGYLQFNLSGQATALARRQINSTTFSNRIVIGPQGKGWVIASNSIFYDVFSYNLPGNRKFTDQCFSWMAGRLRSFVTPTPVSGTTAIGATSAAGFTINSAGMMPGTYQATLKYTTNSPAQPTITIPITIEIPTESTLLPNKSSIAFASTKAGVHLSTTLRLDHKGTVPVTITALELPEGFTVPGATFPITLKNGGSTTLTVRFTPPAAGSFGGNLRIVSDAVTPAAVVPLSGSATLGPVFETPAQLPPQFRFAGSSSTLPLQVANAGPETLTWSSAVMSPSAPGTFPPVLAGLRVGVFANNHQSLLTDLANWGAIPTSIPTTSGLLTPAAYDTIIIDGRMTSLMSAHFSALRDWVNAGGTLILEGGAYSSVSRLNSLIKDSGLSASHFPVVTAQATGFATHPLLQGVTALTATDCEIGLTVTGQASLLASLPDGRGFAALSSLGQGRILALGQQLFSDARYTTGSARLLAANSLSVLQRGRDVAWLSCSTPGGTLVPGDSAAFSLSFDTAGLPPGTYRRQLKLTSNDPLRPTVPLMAEMTVIAPWTIQPASVDFGDVMQGDLLTRTVLISGENPAPLTVTASPLGVGPFQLHAPAQFPVVAGTPATLPITFQPQLEGNAAATLNLETSAGTITIPLHGKGVPSNGFPFADFSAWRSLRFPGGGAFTGLHDDPDGDGLDLGVEYAFLSDPSQRDAANPIRLLGRSANNLRVGYTRRGTFPDSAILLDTSDNLSTWLPFVPTGRILHQNADGSTNVEVEIPIHEARKFFVRGSVGTR